MTSSFSNLNLNFDEDRVKTLLKSDPNVLDVTFSELFAGTTYQKITIKCSGEDDVLLNIYHNKNSTKSISYKQGKNQEKGYELTQLIVNNLLISPLSNVNIFFNIDPKDFKDLIDTLKEKVSKFSIKPILGGTQYALIGYRGDSITIKYFDKKNNIQIQGKPLYVYLDIIELLCECLPYEQFINSQIQAFDIKESTEGIDLQLQSALPNAYLHMPAVLKSIISSSLILRNYTGIMPDYSILVMPMLRAIEGCIKHLLQQSGVSTGDHNIGYFYDKDQHKLKACSNMNSKFTTPIVDLCDFFITHRHPLFHISGIIGTTQIIEDKSDADELITEIIDKINKCYYQAFL